MGGGETRRTDSRHDHLQMSCWAAARHKEELCGNWDEGNMARSHVTPRSTCFLSTHSVPCVGANPQNFLTTQDPSSPQLRKDKIVRNGPYLPFCKKLSKSSFRFSPSSWSSTNLRMTANSAWATDRERASLKCLGGLQGWRAPSWRCPKGVLEPILALRAPWSSPECSTEMFHSTCPQPLISPKDAPRVRQRSKLTSLLTMRWE